MTRDYGREQTSDQQLREMMDRYGLRPNKVGSKADFERDAQGRFRGGAKYAIYNTDPAPPGTHWFAVHEGYVYDPLGDDRSKTQEQPDSSDDCGQRCVAYHILCKRRKNGSIEL